MTATAPLVLVVEDEPHLRNVLRVALTGHGYRFIEAATAGQAESEIANRRPDLVIADLGLPDRNGVDLIRRVRNWSATPILVLSARTQESDKVHALDAGADDYLTKPFSTRELLARLRVALRHAAARGRPGTDGEIHIGDLTIDLAQRRLTVRGVPTHLTPIEFRLLSCLVRKQGQVVTHAELLTDAWGPRRVEQHHYLRIYMAGLRHKLEADPANPHYLQTEIGIGYRLAQP